MLFQHEIQTLNKQSFKMDSNWLQVLTQLIEENEYLAEDESSEKEVKQWIDERNYLLFVLSRF